MTGFSVAEFLNFQGKGIRALAVLSEKRESALPDLQTAVEQGFDVRFSIIHFWWAPKGTPPDRVEELAGMIQDAFQTEAVRAHLKQKRIEPIFLSGVELEQTIANSSAQLEGIVTERPDFLPPLEWIVLGAVVLFGAMVLREKREL